MNRYSSLLFYYCLIVVTFLVIGFLFTVSRPNNILLSLPLLPLLLYMWLAHTTVLTLRHADTPEAKKALVKKAKRRFAYILSAAIVVSVGIFAFVHMFSQTVQKYETTQDATQVSKLKDEITQLKKAEQNRVEVSDELKKMRDEISQLKQAFQQRQEILGIINQTSPASTAGAYAFSASPTVTPNIQP